MFTSLSHLAQYAPGVDPSLTLDDLQPALRTARKRIEAIITPAVFTAIADQADTSEDDDNPGYSGQSGESGNSGGLLSPLRAALANQALSTQLIFDAVNRRRAGTDIYKYEIEAMRRAYAENYFSAMDTLLQALEEGAAEEADGENGDNGNNEQIPIIPSSPFTLSSPTPSLNPVLPGTIDTLPTTPYSLWTATRHHALLATCRIKTAADFDAIYPIDLSYLFFFRTIPLQKEALDERIAAYYQRMEGQENGENGENGIDGENGQTPSTPSSLSLLDLALAKKTVAKALRRFDPIEFPPTIRNLFDDSAAPSNRNAEALAALSLADRLDQEAEQLLQSVDILLDSSADITSATAHNLPSDNIIMAP